MVVLFVIGLMAGAVALSIPGDNSALYDDADRFAVRLAAARDEAVLSSRPVAVWVSPSGYGFERRTSGRWSPLPGTAFGTENWQAGTAARFAGDRDTGRLRVRFDSIGLPDQPLAVTLVRGNATGTVRLSATGEVSIDGR